MHHLSFDELVAVVEQAIASEDIPAARAAIRVNARPLAVQHGARFRSFVTQLPEEVWGYDASVAGPCSSGWS